MVKKRPGPKTKIGPKKKRSKKTVPEPVDEPEHIFALDNKANIPDFICVTDTESEEEPEVKPAKVRKTGPRKILDRNF